MSGQRCRSARDFGPLGVLSLQLLEFGPPKFVEDLLEGKLKFEGMANDIKARDELRWQAARTAEIPAFGNE